MKTEVARPVSLKSTSSEPGVWAIAILFIFFALLWFEVFNHLSNEWTFNAQYSYGWAVPFLAIFLLWQRWPDRPQAHPPKPRGLPIALIFLCSFFLLPIRFVGEANPDWRLLSWGFGLSAVTISLCLVYLTGGKGWLRYFAFPFVFVLIAVPWPTQFEQTVTQSLMRTVTAINVSALNAAGIPALQHGNVIEVTSGLIGIEEACSGVRSLQATLMISLFLGELYLFSVRRRILLIIAGIFLAFVSNLVRTAILVWVGVDQGTESIERWHDPAGLTILLVCLFGLWFLSLFMRRGYPPTSKPRFDSPITAGRSLKNLSWSVPVLAVLVLWLILVESGVQLWYGVHRLPPHSRWAVSWPESQPEYKTVPIAPAAEGMLRYSDGGGASWSTDDGHRWIMYFFHWLPGRSAALFVKIHRPEMCLPAAGLTMLHDDGIKLATVNNVDLPLRSYRFDDHGVPLHVFYCYWDARSSYKTVAAAEQEDWTPRGRLRAALRGRREIGAQMFEIAVWGCQSDADARTRVLEQLKQIIHSGQA